MTQQETTAAEQAISVARSRLVMNQPFYGCLALGLIVARRDAVRTMATDARHLFYNAAFVISLNQDELEGVIVHEVMHCALGHHVRRNGRNLTGWNEAADYSINRDIVRAGFRLPKGLLSDPAFSEAGSEEIYAIRDRAKQGQQQQPGSPQPSNAGKADLAQGQPGNPGQDAGNTSEQAGAPSNESGGQPASNPGNGRQGPSQPAGGTDAAAVAASDPESEPDLTADPGGCGGIMDAAPDAAGLESSAADWAARVKQAASVARQIGRGTLPADIARIVAELDRPRNDWRATLRRYVEESARRDESWSRPNRRMLAHGYIFPGSVPDGMGRLVIVVDTSGSLDSERARAATCGELVSAAEESGADRLTVIWADARVQSVQEFAAGNMPTAADLQPAGGGGTGFSDSFRWIRRNADDAAAIVYVTDLDTTDWGSDPGIPVLWAATCGPAEFRSRRPPFGEAIHVDPDS